MGAVATRVGVGAAGPGDTRGVDGGPPVQRKVGFEFQTSMTKTNFVDEAGQTVNENKKRYYQSDGFDIEGDEGDLELVTKPFEETESGFQEMASTFSWMEVFAGAVEGKTFKVSELPRHFPHVAAVGNAAQRDDLFLRVEEKILTDPQTTVGVKLDRLILLAEALANAKTRPSAYLSDKDNLGRVKPQKDVQERTRPMLGSQATPEALADNIGWKAFEAGVYQKVAKDAVAQAKQLGNGRSDAMKGFLSLLSLYTHAHPAFPREKFQDPYWAKLAIPIISRTNMADLFLKLSPQDQAWFKQNHAEIANALGKHEGGGRVLFNPELRGENYQGSFSIHEWLENLIPDQIGSQTPGLDFSAAYESLGDISNRAYHDHTLNEPAFKEPDDFVDEKDEARRRYKIGTSALHASTDIGKATGDGEHRLDGVILELRKLGAKLTKDEWWPFASDVFKLVVLTNQSERRRDEIIDAFIRS